MPLSSQFTVKVRTVISFSGLAIAAIVGILLNAILPGKDYEFVADDEEVLAE